jgi:hypothetical protein
MLALGFWGFCCWIDIYLDQDRHGNLAAKRNPKNQTFYFAPKLKVIARPRSMVIPPCARETVLQLFRLFASVVCNLTTVGGLNGTMNASRSASFVFQLLLSAYIPARLLTNELCMGTYAVFLPSSLLCT